MSALLQTEFQPIPGHLTVDEAARALGVSAARVRQMVAEGNKFRVVKTVGQKPTYLFTEGEVGRVRKVLDKAAEERARRAAL